MNAHAKALWPCCRRPRMEMLADHEAGPEPGVLGRGAVVEQLGRVELLEHGGIADLGHRCVSGCVPAAAEAGKVRSDEVSIRWMDDPRTIVAMGGGGFSMDGDTLLDDHILSLARQAPRSRPATGLLPGNRQRRRGRLRGEVLRRVRPPRGGDAISRCSCARNRTSTPSCSTRTSCTSAAATRRTCWRCGASTASIGRSGGRGKPGW